MSKECEHCGRVDNLALRVVIALGIILLVGFLMYKFLVIPFMESSKEVEITNRAALQGCIEAKTVCYQSKLRCEDYYNEMMRQNEN